MSTNTQPIPHDPAATFRCLAYGCIMGGHTCAAIYVKAAQTKAHNREHCINCPAGEARARLLSVGPLVCRIPDAAGVECGATPEPNRAQCRKHRAHKSIPSVSTHGADKFQPRPVQMREAR